MRERCGSTDWLSVELGNGVRNYTGRLVEAVTVHGLVDSFSEKVATAGTEAHQHQHPRPLAGGALHSLAADTLVLHRGVLSLCGAGWAAAASLLLRAQLELLMNSAVIWNAGGDMEFMAFKYSYSFLVAAMHDASISDAARHSSWQPVEHGISKLPAELRSRAEEFARQDTPRVYWYQPEFGRPRDVIKAYGAKDVEVVYRILSSPAHGGFIGLRQFRDSPDSVHADARHDPLSEARAMCISSILALDQAHFRALVDNLPDEREYSSLRLAVSHYGRMQLDEILRAWTADQSTGDKPG